MFEVLKQMLTLATSGFGLVAALAWNEFIKEVVSSHIKPLVGESSGTVLAVLVTYNLTKILKKDQALPT